MARSAKFRRRCAGTAFLAAAVVLLIAGQTVLKPRLNDLGFLAYWLICLLFIMLAVWTALLDARAIRRQAQEDQRDLMNETLADIERDAARRRGKASAQTGEPD